MAPSFSDNATSLTLGTSGRNPIIREGDFDTPLPDICQESFTSSVLLNVSVTASLI